jgi:hypothetical protein
MASPSQKPWEVQQGQATAPSDNGPAVSESPQDVIDENDPRLVSEVIDVNVEGDAYAQPAPPPDAKYHAKLKLEGVKQEGTSEKKDYTSKNFGKPPVPAYTTSISCQIIDSSGKYDGIVLYPAFGGGASTATRRDGTTQVATILARIRKPDGTPWAAPGLKLKQKEWMDLFVKALATEPEIGVETSWEASCMKCSEELKPQGKYASRTTGMHHFPPESDPAKRKAGLTFQPEIKCSVNPSHGYSKARAIVTRFLHLHELK